MIFMNVFFQMMLWWQWNCCTMMKVNYFFSSTPEWSYYVYVCTGLLKRDVKEWVFHGFSNTGIYFYTFPDISSVSYPLIMIKHGLFFFVCLYFLLNKSMIFSLFIFLSSYTWRLQPARFQGNLKCFCCIQKLEIQKKI